MFGNAIKVIEQKHPNCAVWKDKAKWFPLIAQDIWDTSSAERIQRGLPVQEKSEAIGRSVLSLICAACLRSEGAAKQIVGVKERVALVTNYLAIGRAGEVGLASFALSHWSTVYECANMYWQEQKRGKQVPLNFFPDIDCMELDFYNAMGHYFIVGGDSSSVTSEPETWIFPYLRANAASKVTAMIQKHIGSVRRSHRDLPEGWRCVGGDDAS
jgi:hypothetical protein